MKRRDFLATSAGLATLLPLVGRSATPCPPPTVSVSGGTASNTSCGSSSSAEADWTARSRAAGVVWAHDFRDPVEVANFRWQGGIGNDYANTGDKSCRHITSDGITGTGCMEIVVPTGGTSQSGWWRPFSALPGDIGYVSGPAWTPSTKKDMTQAWNRGFYGHQDYHSMGQYDGTDFYIQYRGKFQGTRFTAGNPDGKFAYVGWTYDTPTQEIVIQSNQDRLLQMYSAFGDIRGGLWGPQGDRNSYNPPYPVTSRQPGGNYTSTCTWENRSPSTCWAYPADEWFTVLIHIKPGHGNYDNVSDPYAGLYDRNSTTNKDTAIQVWAARKGETSYTKVYDKSDFMFPFDSGAGKEKGWNSFLASAYMNGAPAAVGWYHRYTQIIFSKQFIACPQA
jgi:hypothetical protein